MPMEESDGSPLAGVLLGTLSITTIYSKMLEYVGPRLMSAFGLDINLVVTFFVLAFALYTGGNWLQDRVGDLLLDYYSCTINITSQDPMFEALMSFLETEGAFTHTKPQFELEKTQKQVSQELKAKEANPVNHTKKSNLVPGANGNPFYHATRHLEASLDAWNSFNRYYYEEDGSDDDLDASEDDVIPTTRNRKKVRYSPARNHADYFFYKPTGHTISITRKEIQNSQLSFYRRSTEALTLQIFGKNPAPLKMLIEEAVEKHNAKDHGRTAVHKARQGTDGGGTGAEWIRCFSKPVRSLDTVILDQEQKGVITDDLKEFLLPVTSKWYANRGLPYRRGYLLYGPPGTGKTSLSVALAGKFGLALYSLSLSVAWMNDDTLAMLFSSLPRTCIVLLEDIDACGVTRAQDSNSETKASSPSTNAGTNNTNTTLGPRVSFSGLLNAIDGVASKEGRILIMTTNHRERLDEALIRPGRVDLQIKFTHADRKIICGLFQAIYEISESDRDLLKFPKDFPDTDAIMELANDFAKIVPEGVFSPAKVQGFLLKYKKDPRKAVQVAESWVVQALVEKREKERKEAEREEKERKEKEKQERKERRRKEKEAKEKVKQKAKKDSSDDDTDSSDDEKEEEKVKVKLLNGKEEEKVDGTLNGVAVVTNGVKPVVLEIASEKEEFNGFS